jgi:nitronate monooxygenase
MKTRFTDAFGVRYPIVCAPMALVTGGRLAAAVSRAGGLGIIGGGYAGTLGGEPDLAGELELVRGETFGIGFITWALSRVPHVLDEMLDRSPECVFLSFGDPRPFSDRIHRSGARLICQVQSLGHVEQAIEAGAAAIVAQGAEAGGHGALRSTFPLVPEVADYLAAKAPATLLLAAGGIADGRGLAAALMLGADGVVVGTRFLACEEALSPKAASDRVARATGDDTVRTTVIDALRGVPWPGEFSFRVLKNALTSEWAHREAEAAAAFGSLAEAYADARSRQDLDMVAVGAGECAGLIRDRPSAASIVDAIVAEARELLERGGTLDFVRGNTSSEMRVQNVLERLVGAWNRRDAKSFADLFTADADYVTGDGDWLRGRRAIERLIESASSPAHASIDGATSIRVAGSTATALFRWAASGTPPARGVTTCVLVEDESEGGFRIARLQNTDGPRW